VSRNPGAIQPLAFARPFPHLACMLNLSSMIVWMVLGALALGYWNAARAAAELAGQLGREACARAGVIWLDQSVHASAIHLRRNSDGRLGLEREFRFEYSFDGSDRHVGQLLLYGGRLVWMSGPAGAFLTESKT